MTSNNAAAANAPVKATADQEQAALADRLDREVYALLNAVAGQKSREAAGTDRYYILERAQRSLREANRDLHCTARDLKSLAAPNNG